MRGEGRPVLLVDGGDIFGAASGVNSLEDRIRAETLVEGMNICGYDLATPGEADFRFGERFLAERRGQAEFELVAANLVADHGAPYATPFVRRQIGDAAIVVVGVVGEAHQRAIVEASAVDGVAVSGTPAAAAVDEAFAAAGAAQLRIVIVHMTLGEARGLAGSLDDVDLLIAAHGHEEPKEAEQVGGTVLLNAGFNGRWIGRFELLIGREGGIDASLSQTVALDATFADDPEAKKLYQRYLERLEQEIDEIARSIPQEEPGGGGFVGADACRSCHAQQVDQWSETAHAHAWNTLVLTNHDFAPSCYSCHTTGFGFKTGFTLPTRTKALANVQCEMCHGPAGDHVAAPAAGWSTVDPQTTCTSCHEPHRSPGFDLDSYLPQVTH